MSYKPEILAPGHTTPITGVAAPIRTLTDYREAIRHVVTETIKGMDAGLDPVTVATGLRLPEGLAGKHYLQEFYGHVGYASRACFAVALGWFDGNPTSLGQLSPADEAGKFIELVGGVPKVLAAAETALANGECQWAMQLADRLIASGNEPGAARKVKIKALRTLADQTSNAPTRNYYLHFAHELKDIE